MRWKSAFAAGLLFFSCAPCLAQRAAYELGDTAELCSLLEVVSRLRDAPADQALLREAERLCALPEGSLANLRELARNLARVRLRPSPGLIASVLALRRVQRAITDRDPALPDVLERHRPLLHAALQIELSGQVDRDAERIRLRMASLELFFRKLLDGFDPLSTPPLDEVLVRARHAGLPAVPMVIDSLRVGVAEGVRTWQADLELLLGDGLLLRVPDHPLARVEGVLDVAPLDLQTRLAALVAERPQRELAPGLSAQIEALQVRDGQLWGRLTLDLLGHSVALEVSPALVDGALRWRLDAAWTQRFRLPLESAPRVPPVCAGAVHWDARTGVLEVEGPLSRARLDALETWLAGSDGALRRALASVLQRQPRIALAEPAERAARTILRESLAALGLDASGLTLRELALDPAGLALEARTRWECAWLPEPLDWTVRLPFDGRPDLLPTVAAALAGRRLHFGPFLALRLGEAPEPTREWPAQLDVLGDSLDLWLRFDKGRPLVRWRGDGPRSWVEGRLRSLLAGVSLEGALSLGAVTVDLDGERPRLRCEVGIGERRLFLSVDNLGIHVEGGEELVLAEVARLLRQSCGDWPVRVDRWQRNGDALSIDGTVLLDTRPLLTIRDARFVDGEVQWAGTVALSGAGRALLEESLRGPGWRLAIEDVAWHADGGPSIDLALETDGLGSFRLDDLRLLPELLRPETLSPVIVASIDAHWQKPIERRLGAWTVRVDKTPPVNGTLGLTCSLEAFGARLHFDEARFDLRDGLRPGPARFDARAWAQVLEDRLRLRFGALELRATGLRCEATGGWEDPALLFDLEVEAEGAVLTVPDNRLDRDGFRLGRLPDLEALLRGAAEAALDSFARWTEGAVVQPGPALRCEVLAVAPDAREVRVAIDALGSPLGSATLRFPRDGHPSVGFDDPEAVRMWLSELGVPCPAAECLRLDVRILRAGLAFDVAVRPPGLEIFLGLGRLSVDADGCSWDADLESLTGSLWATAAAELTDRSLILPGLPLQLHVMSATADATGIELEIRARIEALGEIVVRGRVDGAGIHVDTDTLWASAAELIAAQLRKLVPDGLVRFEGLRHERGGLVVELAIQLRNCPPSRFSITIDEHGKLHGFDERLVIRLALEQLAGSLRDRSLALPGGGELRVSAVVVRDDLRGLVIDGSAVLYGPVGVDFEGLAFDGLTPRVLETTKITLRGLEHVLSGLSAVPGLAYVKDIQPLVEGGRLAGVRVVAGGSIEDLVAFSVGLRIDRTGVELELPARLEAAGVHVVIPPCFALSDPYAEIGRRSLLIGALLTLAPPQSEKLLHIDGSVTIPLEGPFVIRADGDLRAFSALPLGTTRAELDFPRRELRASLRYSLTDRLRLDGRLRVDFDERTLRGDATLHAFGARLTRAELEISAEELRAQADLEILSARAGASVHMDLRDPGRSTLTARVGFSLDAFGKELHVVGAALTAGPRVARLELCVLNQNLAISAENLEGITKEKILAALLDRDVTALGLKFLADEGGGGVVLHAEDGTLVTEGADGTLIALVPNDGKVLLVEETSDGNARRVVDAAGNRVQQEVGGASGGFEVGAIEPLVEDVMVGPPVSAPPGSLPHPREFTND